MRFARSSIITGEPTSPITDKSTNDVDATKTFVSSDYEVVYDASKHGKFHNVLQGKGLKGLAHRNGVIRMGGKGFTTALKDASNSFLLEFAYKLFALKDGAKRVTITPEQVQAVAESMDIQMIQ